MTKIINAIFHSVKAPPRTSLLKEKSRKWTQISVNESLFISVKLHTICLLLMRQKLGIMSRTKDGRFCEAHSV